MLAAPGPLRGAAPLLGVVLTGLTGLSGCTAAPPPALVGVSDAAPEPPRVKVPVLPPSTVWPELQAARAWPEASPPFASLAHRRDGSLVHVRVEPAALPAYLALAVDAPMPDGARVIAWHESPVGQVLDGYLLTKRAGSWSAAVIDVHGALLSGNRPACLRCHSMAPTDHLFGLPSASPPAPPQRPPGAESIDAAPR